MNPLPLQLKHLWTPLLLSLAVSQAYAVDVTRTGAAGTPGISGTAPGESGTAGGAGGAARYRITTSDASNTVVLTGGRGGDGGGVAHSPDDTNDGGVGGAGGRAQGRVTAARTSGNVTTDITTRGGTGGDGGNNGCCMTSVQPGGTGGRASSRATAVSGSGDASVQALATGGTGGIGANGGDAVARGWASAQSGSATGAVHAVGGAGGAASDFPQSQANLRGGTQGAATAELTLDGSGVADGQVTATGTAATASLLQYGAGAIGRSIATGVNASSSARAYTTGQAAVDLTALAQVRDYGGGSAEVYVDAGYSAGAISATGNPAVSGRAVAGNAETAFGANTSRLTLLGSGDIVGTSEATGANSALIDAGCSNLCPYGGGSAESYASGATLGRGNVTITATALGGKSMYAEFAGGWTSGGAGRAVASGVSGSGAVVVKALARSGREFSPGEPFADPLVRATAATLAAGGSSYAEARHQSESEYQAIAEAASVGSGGSRAVAIGSDLRGAGFGGMLESRATASSDSLTVSTYNRLWAIGGDGMVTSAANVGGVAYGLPASADGTTLVSYATGLPSATTVTALLADSPALAATDASWLGAGAFAFSNASLTLGSYSEARYSFSAVDGQHLLLGLFGPQGVTQDDYALDFSVTNNGVLVFSSILFGSELSALLDDRLLDLGLLGSGAQNLAIRASWRAIGEFGFGTGYGFNYLMGVSPVPEPATWLAMLLGLGTLIMVARRRRA